MMLVKKRRFGTLIKKIDIKETNNRRCQIQKTENIE